MVIYPYKILVLVETESTRDEETGTWIPGSQDWIDFGKCRDELNGGGAKITGTDQTVYEYSWLIQCPKTINKIDFGAKIKVIDKNGNVRANGSVLNFCPEQLHTRIWVS
ncbi:hypothetical protein CMU68_10020 [Elizabethkingia anophelis]|nr:hypothetical protein [Elizabethkingia anophelis]MDV3786257.1 hypothetical protein [Elizabethkingia anophelis]